MRLSVSRPNGLLFLAALLAAPAFAQQADPASRFTESESVDEFAPAAPTKGGRDSRVTVVLKMAGDSVAIKQATAPGRFLTRPQKEAIENDLRSKQQAIEPDIQARGAVVLSELQYAYNGIKIDAPRSQLAALAALPNVLRVVPVMTFEPDNTLGGRIIGAPAVWAGGAGIPGLHGEGVKVAIIDTGIDYTHADFGGPGTVAAWQAAKATSTQPADPALFGPNSPKIKGGIDLVGDDYNAASPDPARHVRHPDPNPLDCAGHGSHVAGTVAGFGVTASGDTFRGPWDASVDGLRIGPGIAPGADLYAVRVFGCQGSTDAVVDALEWAMRNEMNVVNMSLGSPFGSSEDASAEAAEAAAESGIVVVASAGNSGPAPYITGSPASSTSTLSVAAIDAVPTFGGARLSFGTGAAVTALVANEVAIAPATLPVVVLRAAGGGISLGCDEAEYVDSKIAGKLVVTLRGVCARVDRATFGQRHGAAAVLMINTDAGYPPLEGNIPGVAIPFLGVRSTDRAAAIAADGSTAAVSATSIANPGYRRFASFSSGGPRNGDSWLKPDVSAPGVGVVSVAMGSGNASARMSGTSMAAPHVAGLAALALQAHPGWSSDEVRVAISNTSDPAQLNDFGVRLGGAGLVQALGAARTSVFAQSDENTGSLSFGFAEFGARGFRRKQQLTLHNKGSSSVTFNLSWVAGAASRPHALSFDASQVVVSPGNDVSVPVSLAVAAADVGGASAYRDVSGVITLTPASPQMNGGIALHVPYGLTPRARSNLSASLTGPLGPSSPTSTVSLSNLEGGRSGEADVYAWGLNGESQDLGSADLRAVGVQSFDTSRGKLLVFAVNTWKRWSTASTNEFDIYVDINNDGVPDYLVVGVDFGLLTGGRSDGRMASAVINLTTGRARIRFLATAPTDGSTLLLPLFAADIGVSAAVPAFSYTAEAYGDLGGVVLPGRASFNAFNSSISQGQDLVVAPDATASFPVSIDPAEFARTPALGLMVVTLDNKSGPKQAQLLPVTN